MNDIISFKQACIQYLHCIKRKDRKIVTVEDFANSFYNYIEKLIELDISSPTIQEKCSNCHNTRIYDTDGNIHTFCPRCGQRLK